MWPDCVCVYVCACVCERHFGWFVWTITNLYFKSCSPLKLSSMINNLWVILHYMPFISPFWRAFHSKQTSVQEGNQFIVIVDPTCFLTTLKSSVLKHSQLTFKKGDRFKTIKKAFEETWSGSRSPKRPHLTFDNDSKRFVVAVGNCCFLFGERTSVTLVNLVTLPSCVKVRELKDGIATHIYNFVQRVCSIH